MAAIRPKVAYYAVQNLTSLFDNNMVLNPAVKFSTPAKESLSVYPYQHTASKNQLVAFWLDGQNVTNDFTTKPISFTLENCQFKEPVWVDLMTGNIYEIPRKQWAKKGNNYTFTDIPLYDAPILIAEKALVLQRGKSN